MGTQTFGKGSVQTVMTIDRLAGPNPAAQAHTVSRYYTAQRPFHPKPGNHTQDVVVEATAPAPDGDDAEMVRERNMERHLRNEQGEKPEEHKRLTDHQLQSRSDYLKSWAVFFKAIC